MLLSAKPWTPTKANIPPTNKSPAFASPVSPEKNRIIKPISPINTETNFILVIFSSLKNRNTQKTVNKGMVDINILCNPDDIFFKAYMKVHPGINIAKNPVRQPWIKKEKFILLIVFFTSHGSLFSGRGYLFS